jgi:hypothetical protein
MAADVYAFGVLSWQVRIALLVLAWPCLMPPCLPAAQMISGQKPYVEITEADGSQRTERHPLFPAGLPTSTPAALLLLIQACVSEEPSGRPSSSQVLAELQKLQQGLAPEIVATPAPNSAQ